jgi:hypothetical protein
MQQYTLSSTVPEGTAVGDVRVPDNENTSLPIVMLLHGTSGDERDMADPAAHPGLNHDRKAWIPSIRDHGWRSYPGVSIWGHAVDPFGPVTSWQKALNDAGFRTVNYSQVDPRGSLVEPIAQLSALLHNLINDPRHQGRHFSLLGHSRGGILARALAVDAAMRRPFDLTRIRQIITLHSPNQGSSLANLAISVTQLVEQLRGLPGAHLITEPLNFIQQEAGALAYHDYAVGSNFLLNLAAREPVSGIQYATFGGNSTIFTRHRLWWFTLDSAVPQWHLPPFLWRTFPQELGGLIPPGLSLPPEMVYGIGDLLVTDAAARLPGAQHRTNPLNHAEALWDPGLQQQVVALLKTGAVPPLTDYSLVREQNSAPVYVIFGGAKFWVPDPNVLGSYGGWAKVVVVPDGSTASIPTVPRDGTILREMSSAPVYLMRTGKKCHIVSPEVLYKYGGWAVVRPVPDAALKNIPDGPQVTS